MATPASTIPQMPLALSGVATALEDAPAETRAAVLRRSAMIALIAFLTLIDLFGSQALLPQLVEAYGVSRAAMGFAVNASTIGMAAASLAVALLARRIDRRTGIWLSLALLSIPTAALAFTDDLAVFTALRIVQGVFMATAFTLTVTYLSEVCTVTAVGGALAAYITGNVASNLFGRLLASGVADTFGLPESFLTFAALNLVGAAAAWAYVRGGARRAMPDQGSVLAAWRGHLSNPQLTPVFAIGFLLLFVFVAAFSYANFVLAAPPFAVPQMWIGLVYLVFAPAILSTPLAAGAVRRHGTARPFAAAKAVSILGLGLLLVAWLPAFLLGLTLAGAGLFFAQSVATSHVGRTARSDPAAASGLYLASYYLGGIGGALVVGRIFEAAGWTAAVGTLIALCLAAILLGRSMGSMGVGRHRPDEARAVSGA